MKDWKEHEKMDNEYNLVVVAIGDMTDTSKVEIINMFVPGHVRGWTGEVNNFKMKYDEYAKHNYQLFAFSINYSFEENENRLEYVQSLANEFFKALYESDLREFPPVMKQIAFDYYISVKDRIDVLNQKILRVRREENDRIVIELKPEFEDVQEFWEFVILFMSILKFPAYPNIL